ncbi:MAG: Gfo/Idh/MocA family oxidoreductase [Actinomycetales bacterium]|nr:Gfo/Idh/MocA family oxidoreductase [Actinomycetales bacterium]
MDEPVRWGVIGTGRIAQTFARDLQLIEQGVIVAVGSRSSDSMNQYADAFQVPGRHDSYEALVADPTVEAVYVATPHPMHEQNALLALAHGKHVLVEKAFTMNAEQARRVVAAARERNLFAMEAMWTRFLPHVVAIRELLASQALGTVVAVHADHGKWFESDPRFRLFAPELGGGAVLDLGVYPISFASMVLGTPSSVQATVTPSFTGVDGQTSMVFGYESGAQAVLTCTSLARSATRASIVGTDARIDVDGGFYGPTGFSLTSRTGETTRYDFATQGRGLHYQAAEVARCLRSGEIESPAMPLDETIAIMATMDRVLAFQASQA